MSDRKNNNQRINQLKQELRNVEYDYRYHHDHKDAKEQLLIPIREATDRYIQNRNMYSDTTVICKHCGEIIDMQSVAESDFDAAIFTLKSAINQMKILSDFNTENGEYVLDNLATVLKLLDKIGMDIKPVYYNMIRQYSNGGNGKNKNKGNQRQKGHIGVSQSSFNR